MVNYKSKVYRKLGITKRTYKHKRFVPRKRNTSNYTANFTADNFNPNRNHSRASRERILRLPSATPPPIKSPPVSWSTRRRTHITGKPLVVSG